MPKMYGDAYEDFIPAYLNPEALKQFSQMLGLFHQQTIIDVKLGEEPTDEIDIDAAMAQEEACFVTRDTVYVTEKKSLLINSWYFELLDEKKQEKAIQLFDQLIQAGHPVYVPTADGLQAVDNLVTLRRQLSKLIPVSQETAYQLAASKGLKRDSVYLVDTPRLQMMRYHLNHYHQTHEPPIATPAVLPDNLGESDIGNLERHIGAEDSLSLAFPSETTRLISQKSPKLCDKVRHLIIEAITSPEEIADIFKQFKYLEHLQLNGLTLSQLDLVSFLDKSKAGILTLMGCNLGRIDPADVADARALLEKMNRPGTTLRQLHVYDSTTGGGVVPDLLLFNPGLTDLRFHSCDLRSTEFALAPGHFEKLRNLNLDISISTLTEQQRNNLLDAAPNVTHTSLAKFTPGDMAQANSSDELPVSAWLAQRVTGQSGAASLNQLGSLDMSGCAPGVDDMLAITQSLRSLTRFTANESLNTNKWLNGLVARGVRCDTLKDLSLDRTDINGEGLQSLFTLYPNLSTLSLCECKTLCEGQIELILSGKRGQITHLDASKSSLTQDQLAAILHAEPVLSVLNLANRTLPIDFSQLNLKPGQLAQLMELDLSGTILTPESFDALWRAAPNLRKLTMRTCIINLPESLSQGKLRELSVRGSRISSSNLQTLLEANTTLCHLDISLCQLDSSGCRNVNNSDFMTDVLPLVALTSFIAQGGTCNTLSQLDNLLQSATNLRSIDVTNIRLTEPLGDFRARRQEALVNLRLEGGFLPAEFLLGLLENTPELKRLELSIQHDLSDYQKFEAPRPGSLPKLAFLRISLPVSTDLVTRLVLAAPRLEELNLTRCQFADLNAFQLQRKHLRKLTSLNVSNTNISLEQLQSILDVSPRLTWINISECTQLFQDVIKLARSASELQDAITRFTTQYPDIAITGDLTVDPDFHYGQGGHGTSSASSSSAGLSSCSASSTKFLQQQTGIIRPAGDFKHKSSSTHHTKTIFISQSDMLKIDTHFYHLSAYLWKTEQQAFAPYIPDEQDLVPVAPTSLSLTDMKSSLDDYDATHHRAQFEYQSLNADTWYQLPATSTKDKLKTFASSLSSQAVDLRQDKKTGYHYFRVKHPENRPVLISYVIQTGIGQDELVSRTREAEALQPIISRLRFGSDGHLIQNESWHNMMQAPEETRIAALKAFCYFDEESGDDFSGKPYECFNHCIENRQGACRHRGQLFAALATELGISSWYAENDCHAFAIALQENGTQHTIQLGGAESRVIESAAPTHDVMDGYEEIDDTLSEARAMPPRIPRPQAKNRYQTWNTHPLQATDARALANELIAKSHTLTQQLVVTENKQGIEALHQAVLREHYDSQRCLFTPHLDGVSLTSSHVAADGSCQKVPSALDQFISLAASNPGETYTWFVNWSDAEARHSNLTSLIANRRRQLHGRDLPDNLHLVVVIDKPALGKMGRQFTSRLKSRSLAPELSPLERPAQPDRPIIDSDVVIAIPSDWKKELLGRPTIRGSQATILPGALPQAITDNAQSIRIQNPPMDNEAFRFFRTELEESRGFYFNGVHHRLPDTCTLEFATPIIDLSTERIQALFRVDDRLDDSTINLALNAATYQDFFSTTHAGANGLYSRPGLLETCRDNRICLHITDSLTELQWYKLVTEAERCGAALAIKATPNGRVPPALQPFVSSLDALNPAPPVAVYVSNDVDYALTHTHAELVIPISQDIRFESLFIHLTRDEQGQFIGQETDLLKAIRDGKNIALKGNFSTALVQKLQSLFQGEPPALMVNGESIPIRGELTLISENAKPFAEIRYSDIHFDPEEQFLRLEILPRIRLLRYYRQLNIAPCYSHFKGIPKSREEQMDWVTALASALHLAAGQVFQAPSQMGTSPGSSATDIPKVTTPEELLHYLDEKPFVFLISESGSGKSHLLQQAIPQFGKDTGRPITVYNKLSDIEKWLKHKDGTAILFLDEANISTEDYLMFDNLARGERVVWLKGQRYELSEGQKVVFAGNPYGYGGRKEADLFRRFPHYLAYQGESLQKILQPLMGNFNNPAEAFELINAYYQQALAAGLNITPRNALMMCLRVGEMKLNPELHQFPDTILLQRAISNELKSLTTDKKPSHDLRQQIKADPLWQAQGDALKVLLKQRLPKLSSNDYIWTPSRQKIALLLIGLLGIRQQKIDGTVDPGHGINGFLLEGMEGLGKSQLLTALLKELNLTAVVISLDNPQEARKKLIEAFHNGQIVIIDKLNTMADEKLLNDLLSGIDPDSKLPARKPGFFVLATQNPISSENTNVLSKALDNRLVTLTLKDYSVEELRHILATAFGLSQTDIDAHLQEQQHALNYARQEGLEPLPNTGTLFTRIQEERTEHPDERPASSSPGAGSA